MCMWIGSVNVCALYIFVHVCLRVRCECKLVVGCRPRCWLMVYGQVIYDLSVAGREGDMRLSPQINKRCSEAHITSPLHVCERTDWAPALFFIIYLVFSNSSQLSAGMLPILLSKCIFFYSPLILTNFPLCPLFSYHVPSNPFSPCSSSTSACLCFAPSLSRELGTLTCQPSFTGIRCEIDLMENPAATVNLGGRAAD